EPELDHHRTGLFQRLLEIVDLAIGAHPVGLGGKPFDAFDQHATVPGTVEDHRLSQPWHVTPETPQVGACGLLVGGRRDRNDAIVTRIERARDTTDGPALAGRVHALEDQYQRVLAEGLV